MHGMPRVLNGRLVGWRDRLAGFVRAGLSANASDGHAWLMVFLGCLPVYLLTAHYLWVSVDTQSSVLPAWQLVHHGNVWVEHLHPRPYWSVVAGHHLVSNRMPGTILVNVPMVALLYGLGPSFVPAALTAALLTACAAGLMFLAFRRLVSGHLALVATLMMAFGTSLWTVASAEVWPHTVDTFCLAVAMYALSRERLLMAGFALGAAITARPQVAVVALVVGLGLAGIKRSWRPVLAVGLPATAGLVFVLGWNRMLYGHASISGGYPSYASDNLTSTSASGLHMMLTNVVGTLVSPQRGLLLFLPLSALLVWGVRAGWRRSPAWSRVLAAGGLAYAAVQMKINGFGGGDAFYGYRLMTELVVCASPLAVMTTVAWVSQRDWRVRVARGLAVLCVGVQAIGAVAFSIPDSSRSDPWHWSPILDAFAHRPQVTLLIALATAEIAVWLALQARPTSPERRVDRAGAAADPRSVAEDAEADGHRALLPVGGIST